MSVDEKRPLPEGWEWTTIGEIADDVSSGFPSGRHNQEGRGIPHLRPMNISPNGDIDLGILKYVEEDDYDSLKKGDVLFNNTNSPVWVGKTTYIPKDTNWAYSNHMTRVRLKPNAAEPAWIAYALQTIFYSGFFRMHCSHHVNQASINRTFLSNEVDLPLPSREVQKQVVTEIEKQFTRLDQAVASLKRAQANLRRYKASVLKAACEGNLVPQDPNDETAEILLERILAERRRQWEEQGWAKLVQKAQKKVAQARRKAQGRPARLSDLEPEEWQDIPEDDYARYLPKNDKWKEKYKEPVAPETAELPPLPDGWVWANLNQLATRITDGTHQPPKFTEQGIPFVFVKHIVGGTIGFENTKFISEDTYEQLNSRCPVEQGDILYSAVGSYGVAVPVWIDNRFSFQRHIAHIKPINTQTTNYIATCLNSSLGQDQAHRVARGVAQKTVTLGDLSKFVVPIAPIGEQIRIAEEVERRLSIIAANEKAIATDLARAERLRQSILQQAFSGQLLPAEATRTNAHHSGSVSKM